MRIFLLVIAMIAQAATLGQNQHLTPTSTYHGLATDGSKPARYTGWIPWNAPERFLCRRHSLRRPRRICGSSRHSHKNTAYCHPQHLCLI
jgi:hypothetical protein